MWRTCRSVTRRFHFNSERSGGTDGICTPTVMDEQHAVGWQLIVHASANYVSQCVLLRRVSFPTWCSDSVLVLRDIVVQSL